eukprot:TRINITY_DN11452_c0_g1_i3.p1 TRINITY_DN11452_c0_g1~~TRINITY_DN11452_c0_g1_i3.p1  ORF type:complete len:532 (-),score=152.01 TRINITY_DN11452_c0_g1_i3:440-2035(-)
MQGPPPDRALLAQRIQGFGNVNPPPIPDETAGSVAKKAMGRLGDLVGEEVMLTVEDFKEKGAVGAVKDAVADAGDILIDGVSGIIGWVRGDPPPEDENESAEDATKALAYGPNGAAYGISQASPTGGINAVWVMPDEADPSALAELAKQQGGGSIPQANDPRVPKGIQPYQPPPGKNVPAPYQPQNFGTHIPGGPVIAPYQPAPAGPSFGGYAPGPGAFQAPGAGRWGPGGFAPGPPGGAAGGYAPGPAAGGSSASSGGAGPRGTVERIAKGDIDVGSDVVKRLVSQCTASKTSGKQLGEMICERSRRLYLGLDGGDPVDADASLSRLLALADALKQHDSSETSKTAVEEVKKGVSEELLSLRSNKKHAAEALPMLQRLGLAGGSPAAAQEVDLLGGGSSASTAQADLLGGGSSAPAAEVDLLGGVSTSQPATTNADLLGGVLDSPPVQAAATPAASLDPLFGGTSAPSSNAGAVLGGLTMPSTTPAPQGVPNGSAGAVAGTLGAGAILPQDKKDDDIFGFVGAEMSKAGK